MDGTHQDRSVLVTGGASGIGAATAKAFVEAGAFVTIADVDAAGATTTAKGLGDRAHAVACDVTDPAAVQAAVDAAVSHGGRLDAAFNNAGVVGPDARTAEVSEADFARVVDINLRGVWRCMGAEIRAMLATGGGSIVNTASVAAKVGFYGAPAYAASKHGVIGLTRTAALEYARKGIRVNAVCPGTIDTPMVTRRLGDDAEAIKGVAAAHPMRRLGQPAEVAAAVLWLTSDAASFVTGAALDVDGGFLSQ